MSSTSNEVTVFEKIANTSVIAHANLNGLPGMTSLEISEITGKNHKHVLRDIAKMAEALASRGPDLDRQIINTQYVDSRGKLQPMSVLDKRRTFTLLSRYSFELSDLIVGRWLELEGTGFTRVSVQDSVVHLAEREKDIRRNALRQFKSRPQRKLSERERDIQRWERQASRERSKAQKAGRYFDG